jgi:predicted ATPase/DNA-binding SARP family transcriptional activator/DNA-binding CsgD family transcriptional regulator
MIKARRDRKSLGDSEALQISLLGGFRVRTGSRIIEEGEWHLRKAASLVKLLSLVPEHRLHRERVMDLFWPKLGPKAAAGNLRYALHHARRTLRSGPVAASNYLRLHGDQLVLSPTGQLWVDVEAFEEAAASARRARVPAAYRAALDLYAGELLPGDLYEEWAQDWVEGRRSGLRSLYLALLVEMAGLYEERGEYGPAVEALGRVVADEQAHEEAHVALMRLYAISGRRAEAIRQYEQLREALDRELAAEPAQISSRVYEEILAGRPPPSRSSPAGASPEDPPSVRQHNLPSARTSFVGREREIVEVRQALVMTALLTLTGAGGSGKTRLALEAARDLVGAYPDGVWFVELAPLTDSELVAQAVAGVLGVREQQNSPLLDTLAGTLQKKKMLLVLDNCEHLVDGAARLADTLLDRCPRVRILATSREPLSVAGEVNWPVPPLSLPDAEHPLTVGELEGYESARLFVERALYRPSAFALTPENARAVAEICTRLDGIPLAIELAASRIGALAVEQISERLSDSLKLLTSGGRTATPRQQTLRGALNWSYELLGELERKLFVRLSVFAGGWTLEAVEVVGAGDGIEQEDVLDLISRLVDKSLVVAEPGEKGALRYRMLETVRQYAHEKLERSGESDTVRRRHASFFVSLGEALASQLSGPEMAFALDRIAAELPNVRAALNWTLEREEAEKAVQLAGALYPFWNFRGHLKEGRRWLDAALARDGTPTMTRVDALLAAAGLAALQGDHARAEALAEKGLTLSRTDAYPFGTVRALFLLGITAEWQGDADRAAAYYEETLSRRSDLGASHWVARSLAALAAVTRLRGDSARAKTLAEEALDLAREAGHAWTVALALGVLANVAADRHDYARAVPLYEESLGLSLELGNHWGVAGTVAGLAGVVAAQGQHDRAARLLGAARELGDTIGVARLAQHEEYDRVLADARAHLDDSAFAAAWEAGRAMTLEEVIEYALSGGENAPPTAPAREESPVVATLTFREREVVTLLARGLSDRAVARELSVSERTVTTHVGRIFKKLGFHSRAQVAAWAVEERLLQQDPR